MITEERKLELARHEISSIQNEISELKGRVSHDGDVSESVLKKLNTLVQKLPKWTDTIKSLDNIPGLKNPKWYTVDIPFDFGDTLEKKGSVDISVEGPFVCTQIQAYYVVEDTDPTHYPKVYANKGIEVTNTANAAGRVLPCSSYDAQIQNLMFTYFFNYFNTYSSYTTIFAPTLRRGYGWNYPEFDFKIHIDGSGRYWAGSRVPAPAFYGLTNPLYLGFPGVVENTDKIVVTAYPTTGTVNLKGTVRMVFHGYQIRGNFNVVRELGYI